MKTKYPWLGPLNYYLLQFFFIRLAYSREILEADLYEFCVTPNNISAGMRAKRERVGWAILYVVVPFTGWGGSYKFIGRCRYKWFRK